jgi:hypothetical protein
MGSVEPMGGFWAARVLYRENLFLVRPLESETRHWTLRRYMYTSRISGASALLRGSIDANRKAITGKVGSLSAER